MKPDYSTRQLNRLRRRILRVYSTARREMQDQLTEFLDHFEQLDAHKRELLDAGKITKADYQTWLRNQVFQSELMQQKLDNITRTCTTAQETAYRLSRDEQYDLFAFGANYTFYELEQAAGASFNLTLYNTESVKRLLLENPKLVPNKRIKSESNKTYDARIFNRYVLQGIVQGKSVHDIAQQAVNGMADTEIHWAMNNAITALTGAQNAGALQQMRHAKELGIEVQKRWNATLDYRTRETHRLLDQETADLDEPFRVEGYEIQYPGDPNAAPEMVYHCRCKVTSFLPKYPRRNASRRDNITGEVVPEQSYEEWYEGKEADQNDLFRSIRGSGNGEGNSGETIRKFLGTIDLNDTERIESVKDAFCKQYSSSPVENMMVITQTGEVHFMTDNNPRGVDCSYLGDKLEESYNIHTHPPDTTQYSFSTDADIPAAFSDGTAIMEAVDYKYRYRFEVPSNITFDQWDLVRYDVEENIGEVMAQRGYTLDDVVENQQHVLIDEICRRLGISSYSRWKR